eukprot:SAG31_NODE_3099_length_4677_cov_15.742246_3_plen_111_part_00
MYDEDKRRCTIQASTTFDKFKDIVAINYNIRGDEVRGDNLLLRYEDDGGAEITVATQQDWDEAWSQLKGRDTIGLKLTVTVRRSRKQKKKVKYRAKRQEENKVHVENRMP